jgi:ATP-dependent helicase/nuclease subunit B
MARHLRTNPNLYTIPAGEPFADRLASGLMERYGADPAALGRVTVLLPTRRAARSLREAFLRQTGGRALILPMMRPIGDVDEDELLFFAPATLADMDLAPAAPPLWRQITLTRLVERWRPRGVEQAMHPAHAAVLARELGRFLDQVAIEGVDMARLEGLVTGELAVHWQDTLDFLDIVGTSWPAILKEEGYIDGADRRVRLIDALIALWSENPPADPVIAAGSTGSMPTTARLLAHVARLPEGAVVLPGLDLELDKESWDAVDPSHPQYAMKTLLDGAMGAVREEVKLWDAIDHGPAQAERGRLLREALRPAATTSRWPDIQIDGHAALTGLRRIDAPGPREEAGVISLLMREALETPGRTAALITPDRTLARRVAGELKRWDIDVDDSGGVPVNNTPPGAFLRLVGDMAADGFAPLATLACLKHPLAGVGRGAGEARTLARRLERAVLRGPRPAPGAQGMAAAIAAIEQDTLRTGLQAFWADVTDALGGFDQLLGQDEVPLVQLVEAHVRAAEGLAATADESGASRLWQGEAGEAAARFIEDLLESAGSWAIKGEDYPALLATLMTGRPVRPQYGRHPRLQILGPLEARMQQADLVILGGLNEGTWPPEPEADPWMSRPMRAEFGLPPLEARVGLSAHDFVQAASAPEVVLTRAEKVDGTPAVPSRWLLRIDALLRGVAPEAGAYGDWFEILDRPDRVQPADAPRPAPPVAARPTRLSVTQVQNWMRDPYSIYARHILGLEPLDPIDADPGAAEKGNIIHDALDKFLGYYPEHLPDEALNVLIDIGRDAFGDTLSRPAIRAFWWPRFLHVAEWFIATERDRRRTIRTLATEIKAEWPVSFTDGGRTVDFTLVAKADRLDAHADGRIEVIDYKTGSVPPTKQIRAGYAPQLPLEALMVEAGAFKPLPPSGVAGLSFWRLHGGDPPAEIKSVKDHDVIVDLAAEGFEKLVTTFANPRTPYLASPRPEAAGFGDYDHLARVKEWSGVGAALPEDLDAGDQDTAGEEGE